MKIILPKTFVDIDPDYGPIFYLTGPVRGGGDWQKDAVEELQKHLKQFYVAIPYYHKSREHFPLRQKSEPGAKGVFEHQLNWERHYIDLARENGCQIFWIPNESKTNPRSPGEGSYGEDTRGEIARAGVELKYNRHYKIVVGTEGEFHSFSQIHRNFALDQGFENEAEYPIYPTLAGTIAAAVTKTMKY